MRTTIIWAATLAATLTPSIHAQFVYENSTGNLDQRLSIGNVEVGDEIVLAGTGRMLTGFDFEYYGISFSGNEQARLRFYQNDGELFNNDPLARKPLTMFFDSGLFDVAATARNTLNFSTSDSSLPAGIALPERFTFTVQFSGIEAGESAGVDLYDPPTAGESFPDYWYNDSAQGWQTRTNVSYPMNFGARIQAVPEPSAWALCLLGAIAGSFYFRRNKR
jgi:hypothetical protein